MKKSLFLLLGLTVGLSLVSMPGKAQETHGYEKTLELGYSIGYGKFPNYTYNFSTVHGLRFTKYLFAGIGTGVSYSNQLYIALSHNPNRKFREDALFIPAFGQIKVNFSSQALSPFVSMNAGFLFDVTRELGNAGGLLLQPNVGVNYRLDNNIRGFFQVGLRLHRYKYGLGSHETYYIYDPDINYPEDIYNTIDYHYRFFQAIDLRFGLQF